MVSIKRKVLSEQVYRLVLRHEHSQQLLLKLEVEEST